MYKIPITIFAVLAFLALFTKAGGLKAICISSFCGVIIVSFTGGASGAVWLAPLIIFIVSIFVIWRPKIPAVNDKSAVFFTNLLFIMFVFATLVALFRYDASVEMAKSGSFRTFLGFSIEFLMAGYHIYVISFLFLAIVLPLRYHIDKKLFLSCLKLCWVLTLVLAIFTILDYIGVGDFAYDYRRVAGYGHVAILGFHRAPHGLMIYFGIFMAFAMSQLTSSKILKMAAYCSAPVLIMALLFTWSRSAMMAMMIGSVSLVLTLGGARAIKGLLITVAGGLIIAVILMQYPDVAERFAFFTSGDAPVEVSSAGRVDAWVMLLQWLSKNPGVILFGAGFQNFNYFVNVQSEAIELEAAHNNFLHILTELGIVGLFVFLGWLISIICWLWNWRKSMLKKTDKMVPGIFLSAFIGTVFSCLTQESLAPSPSMVPWLVHFYLMFGIWMSYYRYQTNQYYDEHCEVAYSDQDDA